MGKNKIIGGQDNGFVLHPLSAEMNQDLEYAVNKLRKYNRSFTGPFEREEFGFIVKNEAEEVVGMINAHTDWEWVYIKYLWVDVDNRKKGLGTYLIEAVIKEANKRGRFKYYLSTFEFQAPEFYKKLGFEVFGILPNVSGEYSSYYLKRIDTDRSKE